MVASQMASAESKRTKYNIEALTGEEKHSFFLLPAYKRFLQAIVQSFRMMMKMQKETLIVISCYYLLLDPWILFGQKHSASSRNH